MQRDGKILALQGSHEVNRLRNDTEKKTDRVDRDSRDVWVRNMGTDQISKKKTCQMSKGQWRGVCQVKKRKIETGTSISVPKQKKTDILKRIEQKWRWIEHMMRDTRDKWSQAVTEWGPRDEKRNRGRQLTMWEDETKLSADPNWRRVARDRKH